MGLTSLVSSPSSEVSSTAVINGGKLSRVVSDLRLITQLAFVGMTNASFRMMSENSRSRLTVGTPWWRNLARTEMALS